jgi:hypothetical protein
VLRPRQIIVVPMTSPTILVLGPGKSGTTALHYCLKESAEVHCGLALAALFEAKSSEEVSAFLDAHDGGIVKILVERYVKFADHAFLPRFGRRVLISRDPRDNVVSRLIWIVATRLERASPEVREAILSLLARKQADPDAVSLLALFAAVQPLVTATKPYAAVARRMAYSAAAVLAQSGGAFFALRYEDFVDGRLEALEGYLGFPVQRAFELAHHERVRRTASYGAWRNWFLPEDYAFFAGERRDELAAMGYADTGPYAGEKRIAHEEALGYVERLAGSGG